MILRVSARQYFYDEDGNVELPAIVLELKWNRKADTAIGQIRRQDYGGVLSDYAGSVVLVGVSYDKRSKRHECVIERMGDGKKDGKKELTERQRLICSMLREDGRMTIPVLAGRLGVSPRTVSRELEFLQAEGFISRVDGRKDGAWRVEE